MTNDQFIEELRVEANLLRDRDWKGDQRAAELLEEAADRLWAFSTLGAYLMRENLDKSRVAANPRDRQGDT